MKLAFTKMNGLGNDVMVVEWPKGAPPPKDPNLQIMETKVQGDLAGKKMDNETKQAQLQLKQREMDQDLQKWMIELEEERRVNDAKILELMAKAEQESANAQTEQQYAQVAVVNTEIAHMRAQSDVLNRRIEIGRAHV